MRGHSIEVIPDYVPYQVAALNEPMAVARHAVNQVAPKPTDRVAVFGAGPIGLGATIALKSLGVGHVVVIDLLADSPGQGNEGGGGCGHQFGRRRRRRAVDRPARPGRVDLAGKSGTDIYLDAAGASEVVTTALAAAQRGATLGIVGVHKEPVTVDLMNVMSNELTIVGSMGYPDEIFEVTKDIIEHWEKYAVIVSHTFAFDDLDEALRCAATPGASDKIVITFD